MGGGSRRRRRCWCGCWAAPAGPARRAATAAADDGRVRGVDGRGGDRGSGPHAVWGGTRHRRRSSGTFLSRVRSKLGAEIVPTRRAGIRLRPLGRDADRSRAVGSDGRPGGDAAVGGGVGVAAGGSRPGVRRPLQHAECYQWALDQQLLFEGVRGDRGRRVAGGRVGVGRRRRDGGPPRRRPGARRAAGRRTAVSGADADRAPRRQHRRGPVGVRRTGGGVGGPQRRLARLGRSVADHQAVVRPTRERVGTRADPTTPTLRRLCNIANQFPAPGQERQTSSTPRQEQQRLLSEGTSVASAALTINGAGRAGVKVVAANTSPGVAGVARQRPVGQRPVPDVVSDPVGPQPARADAHDRGAVGVEPGVRHEPALPGSPREVPQQWRLEVAEGEVARSRCAGGDDDAGVLR